MQVDIDRLTEAELIDGNTFGIADPAGPAPFAVTASGLSFTGNDLVVTLNRSNEWVFLSEVTFAVPEPETYALMLIGLGIVATTARGRHACPGLHGQ